MIPKGLRLKRDRYLPFNGRKHRFNWGLLIVNPDAPTLRWSVSVSKKVSPKAVIRNRLRRQLTQHLYTLRLQLKPHTEFCLIITHPPSSPSAILSNICSLLYTKSPKSS